MVPHASHTYRGRVSPSGTRGRTGAPHWLQNFMMRGRGYGRHRSLSTVSAGAKRVRGGSGRAGHSQGRRPNTATPFVVPTNTLPSAMVGVMNLLPAPN